MLCRVVVLVCVILVSSTCLAQSRPRPRMKLPSLDRIDQPRPADSSPPATEPGTRTSLVRLSVPRKARELYDKAQQAFVRHKNADAQRKLDQALKLHRAFPEALTLSALIQVQAKQFAEAEDKLQEAIRIDHTYALPYIYLAEAYNLDEKFDAALDMTQRYDALVPGSWAAQFETARALIGKRQYDRALTITEELLRTQSEKRPILHLAKAHALTGLKRYPEAAAELQTYLGTHPQPEDAEEARNLLSRVNGAMPH